MKRKSRKHPRRPVLETIEARILYSADFSPGLVDAAALATEGEQRTLELSGEFAHNSAAEAQLRRHEIVFVDTATPDYARLIEDLRARNAAGDIEVVRLDAGEDGVKQITETLAARNDISAVHLVSHGSDGNVQLGASTLNFGSLLKSATQIKGWGRALTADADVLIYGCNVAATQDGKSLIDALARLTGADVAASDDLTGAAARGGDWDLEFQVGRIDTSIVFSQSVVLDWAGTLQGYAFGGETLANTTTTNAQQNDPDIPQSVAMDANGNYVVVWSGQGTGDTAGVFARRYNSAGAAQGAEFRVNTTTANAQSDASVAMDINGNFVVAWTSNGQDGSGTGIYAQRYNAAGVAQGGEFRVNSTTANAQVIPMVAIDAAGNFVIAWQSDLQDGGGAGVYAQRYNAAGAAQGVELRVNVTTAGNQYLDDIAMDAAGNFIVTYSSPLDGSGDGVYMRHYNAAGTALGGEVRVNTTVANDQNWSSVAMAPTGEFVVAWRSNTQDGSLGGIYAQRFNAAGVAQGGEVLVNTTTSGDQGRPVVAMGADGRFVIAWQSSGQDSPGTSGIYKQEYNADGSVNGVETLVNTTVTLNQANPSIAISGTGAFVVSWSGNGTGDGDGVFWQRYVPALYVDTASDVLDGTTTSISALLGNKGADGFISLREAITAANNTANIGGPDRIYFSIAGSGPHIITLAYDGPDAGTAVDALPTISQALIIDASTEPDFAGTPVIELRGGGTVTNAFNVAVGGAGSTIRGFVINGFAADSILLAGGNNLIAGNYVGTNVTGSAVAATPNAEGGIRILTGSDNNIIGGTTALDRNIFAGNGLGANPTDNEISLHGANNLIIGNYIGVAADGTTVIGNLNDGIDISTGAANNIVGGLNPGEGNRIAGHTGGGVRIQNGATGTLIRGNTIWANGSGVAVSGASTGHLIQQNSIYGNTGLGIDLLSDGVTANDPGDGDTGPNDLQNYPVLLAAASAGGFTTVTGTLNSTASSTFTIHFYSNPVADGSGYGEGQVYLGSTTVTTDASGNAVINAGLAVNVTTGHVITATVTNAGNDTSEFSAAVAGTAGRVLVVDTVSDAADGDTSSLSALYANKGADGRISLREAITAANNTANAGAADLIRFNILGAGPHTINLASALPDITDAVSIDGTSDPDFAGSPIIELNGAGTVGVNGLNLTADGNTIRGLIINRFDVSGIQISSSSNVIVGNWIGINSAGTADAGNSDDGITISGNNNIIGGTTAVDRNVISGNDDDGLDIDPGFIGNVIIGNWIGTNATNSGTIANGGAVGVKGGVRIEGDNNRVGGTAANEANVIRGNWGNGVYVWGTGNQVLGNSIYGNQLLGIDLNQDGVTANDGAKSPGQPNLLMDFPVIQSAALNGTTLTVSGVIGTAPDDTDFAGARVEFFETPDAAGANGEGQTYLGSLVADASGNFSGSFSVSGLAPGDRITGTATDAAGNTSEFGLNVVVVDGTPVANADSYSVNEDGTLSVPGTSQWWNTSWTQRQQLTFNNLAQAENLVDFPVLVQLDSSRINYALTQNAGQDLRFVDADGTPLAYEIESWNELGTSYVWVKVPQIDGSSGADHIWMYYGNASAPAGQNPAAVWTSSFSAVYHLNDGGATIQDSSSNNFDGTALAGGAGTTGYVAGGQTFDGVDDRVDMGADRTLVSNVSGATLSAWIRTDTVLSDQSIISLSVNNGGAPTSTSRAALELTGDDIKVIGRSTDAEAQMAMTTTGNILAGAVGAWHYLTGVVDYANNTITIYLDGVQQATTGTVNFAQSTTPSTSSTNSHIAAADDGVGLFFDGALDEARIETVARSANWIAAQYLSTNDSFISFGTAQGIGVLNNDSDPNGDVLTTVLVAGPSNAAAFTLNANGSFTYTPEANFNGTDTFTYRVNDGSGDSNMATVTITVNPVDDPIGPIGDVNAAANSVAENAAVGTTVGITALASDPDITDTVTYTLDDDAGGRFAVNGATGVVTVAGALNREAAASHNITVRATSSGGGFSTQVFAIAVTDVDEFDVGAISDANGAVDSVAENAANGTVVGVTAFASDADATTNAITYSLDNSAGGRFAIDGTTGVVTVAGAIDREAAAGHNITVRATSADGSFSTQVFAIAVSDVDEFDVGAISDTDAAANSVAENAANGTLVGITASASDADATTNTITYSLDNSAGGRFAIDGTTGVVTVAGAIDREAAASHNITVRASSADGSFSTQVFAIAVSDVDEFDVGAISDVDGAVNNVAENAANGTVVGLTALANDADATNNTIAYSLTDDAGGRFAIDGVSGVVSVADGTLLDREAAASHNITVRASSADGSFSTQVFAIAVTDVDEFDVGAISDANGAVNSVAENAANGTVVGLTAVASDADATTNAITYSLDNSAGGRFAIDGTTGVVTVAGAIDREAAASHNITVRATSADGSFSTQVFAIAVSDVDEFDVGAISDVDGAVNSVAENAANGTVVGVTAFASDADATTNAISYSLDNSAGGRFAIDGTTGVVTVAGAIDREAAASHSITVRATSADGSFSTQAFNIAVTDVDEFDVGAISDANGAVDSVAENAANGTVVGVTAFASDADATMSAVTYSLTDDAGGLFAIDSVSGVVTVAGALDAEAASSHSITVQAVSADGSLSSASFLIAVNDLNEFPVGLVSDVDGAVNELDEDEPLGSSVGITAEAVDLDASGNAVTYSLDDDAGGRFAIDALTGDVSLAGAIDREAAASHNITVRATSADGSFSTQVFAIAVNDVDEFDVGAIADVDAAVDSVVENTPNGTVVGVTAMASDADATINAITYTLDDDAGGRFAIDATTGVVSVADGSLLDREAAASHAITVRATSADGSFGTQAFAIAIADVDEFDIGTIADTDASADAVAENAANGIAVGVTAFASDADATGNAVTYTLDDDAAGRFAIDGTTGVVSVADGSLLDREAAASHAITVRATSADGSFSTQGFTIAVTDVNEFGVGPIADADASVNAVAENSPAGTLVGISAFASDADATTNAITYTLDDDAGGRFAIDGSTGVVSVAGALDYETAVSHNIIVRASSADGSFSTQTLTVNVSDSNELPVFNDQSFGVAENTPNGSVVGALLIADPDVGDTASYSIVVGNPGGAFAIDALGQVLVANSAMLDFETTPTFTLTVQVQDGGGLTDTADVTINLAGVNEAPVLVNNTLSINQGAGLILSGANVSVSDVDNGPAALTFTVSNLANGWFERVASPGVAVASFTQAEVLAGQVRFVQDGSASAPGFDLQVSDGLISIGPFSASVSFNPAPIVFAAPPASPPAPPPLAIEPPPAPAPAPEPAAPLSEPGEALIDAGFSPGRVLANFNDLTEIAVRLAAVEARVPLKVAPPPESNLNDYEAKPAVEPQVELLGLLPAQLSFTPSVPVDWVVASAFGEGAEEHMRSELQVLLDSVKFGGMALSVGVVWWASRISGLLGTLLASTPAWRHIDPLPVLGRDEEKEDQWYEPDDRDADANELAVSLVLEGGRQAERDSD